MNVAALSKRLPGSTRALATRAAASDRERVVILGSGWAGYSLARNLDPAKYERVVISPRSHFVFTPLLAGAAAGTLELGATTEPVRRLGLDHFHQGWADKIDLRNKTITVESNIGDERALAPEAVSSPTAAIALRTQAGVKGRLFDVPYDKLVVAVGAYSQTFGVKGVRHNAHFLRDVGDARAIRMRLLRCFERAALPTTTDQMRRDLLHFAVVGGGPTGIEFSAELHDLIHEDMVHLYPELIPLIRITVYDVAPKVLPMFDAALSGFAMNLFKRQNIEIKTQHHILGIRRDNEAGEDGEGVLKLNIKEFGDQEVGAGLVVWSTGLTQNPVVKKLQDGEYVVPDVLREAAKVKVMRHPRSGSIIVDDTLRVKVQDTGSDANAPMNDVFAIGDCASVEGAMYPATAQVASQQAAYLAKQLNKDSGLVRAPPFKFRNLGVMAYVGSWNAMYQANKDGLKGRAAWLLWRMAYVTKSMSWRNRLMVPFSWMSTWLFGRDITRY
ncbi:hypothetical protein TD95_002318 [Thielaviopsis punctulata]|uniref:Uncharacterized protein n=1 Tax=Thielaviopsis punctulata TaxID=72032 RepID=A0A0F4ZCY7_9PEZI|nr:hypothetical protein TD95_002318 [Thielaviopsis punctulata]